MRLILRYMRAYSRRITLSMFVKLLGAVTELMIPYILEHLIDEVVPLGQMGPVVFWGALMIVIRKQQGAPSALSYLKEIFGDAGVIARSKGYWILRAQKKG